MKEHMVASAMAMAEACFIGGYDKAGISAAVVVLEQHDDGSMSVIVLAREANEGEIRRGIPCLIHSLRDMNNREMVCTSYTMATGGES